MDETRHYSDTMPGGVQAADGKHICLAPKSSRQDAELPLYT